MESEPTGARRGKEPGTQSARAVRAAARGWHAGTAGRGLPSRRLAPPRRSQQPHSSGFPTHSPSKGPQSASFSRTPPPLGLQKLFFTPSWSLICCGERKRLLLGEGLHRGRGRGAGDCVPQLRAWGLRGGSCRGARGAEGRRRADRAGVGQPGRAGQAGRLAVGESGGKGHPARKPIVLLALLCTWPGDWREMATKGSGHTGRRLHTQ